MIPHHNHRDVISFEEINELLAALGQPPTVDHPVGGGIASSPPRAST